MEADLVQPGRASSGVSGLWDNSRGWWCYAAVPMVCSTPPPRRWWKWLAGLLGKQGALPQGSQNWQDCPTMEADFAQLGRVCSIISGLQDFSRGLAVLCTAPQGCSSSRGQGRENP